MQLEDVKKLASLARIDMSEEEMEEVAKDFDSILAYVDQIRKVSASSAKQGLAESEDYFLQNVMREDVATNKTGEYTEKILKNAPNIESGFLKVKQIL